MKYLKNKSLLIIVGLLLLIFAQVLVIFFTQNTRMLEAFLTIPISVAGCAIFYQLYSENKTNKGNFVLTLENDFSANATFTDVLAKIYHKELCRSDSVAIVTYLGFFEVVNVLLERRAIDIKLVDRLFRMRFFRATMSSQVQVLELLPCWENYKNIQNLDKEWRSYLQKIGEEDTLTSYGVPLHEAYEFAKLTDWNELLKRFPAEIPKQELNALIAKETYCAN